MNNDFIFIKVTFTIKSRKTSFQGINHAYLYNSYTKTKMNAKKTAFKVIDFRPHAAVVRIPQPSYRMCVILIFL